MPAKPLFGMVWWAGVLLLAPCLVALSGLVWRQPPGQLRWDGAQWWWQGRGQAERLAQVVLALDLQRYLLLRGHVAQGGGRYWWLLHRPLVRPGDHPPATLDQWTALRRALYWHATPAFVASPHHPASP